MRIVITGYGGFVGTGLVRALQPHHDITGIIQEGEAARGLIRADITKPGLASRMRGGADCIIHLAALSDVQQCHEDPASCMDTNVQGTANVLDLARRKDAGVIFASSSHVYEPRTTRLSEGSAAVPHTIYGASKLAAEGVCGAFARMYGMDITILRLFSIYGGSGGRGIISRIVSQLAGGTIQLGNTEPMRDFVHIDDVISAFELAAGEMSGLKTYNVGTGRATSIRDVFGIVQEIWPHPLKLLRSRRHVRNIDADYMCADISRIRGAGWSPQVSLREGLRGMISGLRQDVDSI